MFRLHLSEILTLRNKHRYVFLQTFPPKSFLKVMVHHCGTRMNRIAGPMGFLKDPVSQSIYLGNTESTLVRQNTIPPKEYDSFSLRRNDSFNSINHWSRCCLDFTSTTKDHSKLFWGNTQPLKEYSNLTPNLDNLWTYLNRSFWSSSMWDTLHKVVQIRESATTLALPGW